MLTGAHARGRKHSLQGQGNFILENVQAHHIIGGGGEESASKNGQGAAEGAAAVSSDGSLSPVPAPVTQGGRGDAKQKPPQVAGLQLRDRAAEERRLFLLASLPRARTHPLSAAAMLPALRKQGDNARLRLAAGNRGFKLPVLEAGWGGTHTVNLDVVPVWGCFFGEKSVAKTGSGVSREHRQVTAFKDPTSYGPEVSIRESATPLALATQAGEKIQPREGKA